MSPTSYLAALPRVKSTTREVYQSLRAVSMHVHPLGLRLVGSRSPGETKLVGMALTMRRMWKVGDRLTHRHNPELGPGRVVSVEGRSVVVEFPAGGADGPLSFQVATRGGTHVVVRPRGRPR